MSMDWMGMIGAVSQQHVLNSMFSFIQQSTFMVADW